PFPGYGMGVPAFGLSEGAFVRMGGEGAAIRYSGLSNRKRRSCLRRLDCRWYRRRAQRSSWSTLCWLWLDSASADTAIDCRVDSAWLLGASSLVSARVRLAEPVCSTLIRFFEKSWRICTIDRFEPRVEACVRNASDALVIL